jgi:hypothetical protein
MLRQGTLLDSNFVIIGVLDVVHHHVYSYPSWLLLIESLNHVSKLLAFLGGELSFHSFRDLLEKELVHLIFH